MNEKDNLYNYTPCGKFPVKPRTGKITREEPIGLKMIVLPNGLKTFVIDDLASPTEAKEGNG